jgi:hypothetical protein
MNDMDKLRMLLPHWLAHNAEHAAEFRTWAARMRQAGQALVAEHIEAAALRLEAVSQELEKAIPPLGRAEGSSQDSVHSGEHAHG